MDNPLVSIVVISYNQGRYIKENLDSIKNQSYPNIELIVADDASTDNSVEIFDNWLKENSYPAKKNYHQKNTGLATMLNECIELATGKYIKLIAADDFLDRDYIKKSLSVLQKNNTHLVFTNANSVDDNSYVIQKSYFDVPNYKNIDDLEKLVIEQNFVSGATLFTTLEIYKILGKYSVSVLLDDYNLVLKAIQHDLFIEYIDENLVNYRRHSQNITIKKFDKLNIETIKEKILFDKQGNHKDIIHQNIRIQKEKNNPYLKELKKIYFNYKGFNIKFFIINFFF